MNSNKWQTLTGFLSFLFFPPVCPDCGRSIARSEVFCPACKNKLERPLPGEVCARCGKNPCICPELRPAFDRTFPAAYYTGSMTRAIHNLKFNRHPGHAKTLAPLLALTLREAGVGRKDFDLLAAAPMSRKRYKQRGYNQAALLAAETAKLTGIPFDPKALTKIRETKAQHDLSAEQRRTNLNGTFRADAAVRGKRVLLCDDVLTTGSTANEAAQALLSAGAQSVDVLVLSVTKAQIV